ncbi:hypothetical protein [Rhizorhapis suberifaciens]|uniref:Uncharacterized protein n=1 Tax=Rhizorhapis suberifaciens TaxID=13656 RepID=A0A840HXU4_9SPHN|nr:hypothetical protein [Rhizorhapis suberifaciens]MBB4642338.1 hypothetical protein [Rhizorhapis suberifaciens]
MQPALRKADALETIRLVHTERGDVDLLDTARENGMTVDQLIQARPSPPMVINDRIRAAGIAIFGREEWGKVVGGAS